MWTNNIDCEGTGQFAIFVQQSLLYSFGEVNKEMLTRFGACLDSLSMDPYARIRIDNIVQMNVFICNRTLCFVGVAYVFGSPVTNPTQQRR